MNSKTNHPYELHTHGVGAFIIFNAVDQVSLPLMALARATLRGTSERGEIALAFPNVEVVIEGRDLANLLEHILAGRVKRISPGRVESCEVASIHLTEIP